MTDLLSLVNQGLQEFGTRVHGVGVGQWSTATPCSKWTVSDLVGHVTEEHLWAPPLLAGHSLDTSGSIVAGAKQTSAGDPVAQWDAAALASSRAFGEPSALERDVELSRGPTPAAEYAREMVFDLTVHAWDLGTAIGLTDPLPEELVQFVLGIAESFGDMSATGMFLPPVPVPDDATAEQRLVALTGRQPR